MSERINVYVVSYLENGNIEPIISVFDNEDAARGGFTIT